MRDNITFISNAKIVTMDKIIVGSIEIKNGHISDIYETVEQRAVNARSKAKMVFDANQHYILPGFIDIHCHGGNGSSFMDLTEEDFMKVIDYHHHQGVTTLFPTSLSCSNEELIAFLQMYMHVKKNNQEMADILAGVHLEGPYLSKSKAGAQAVRWCTPPDMRFIKHLVSSYSDIKRWTLAPEVDSEFSAATYLMNHNVLVSAGHTDILFDDMMEASKHGYKHMTHLYSSMNSLVYVDGLRRAGAVEAAFLNPDLTVELIADGIHLPYPFIELVYRLKGSDRIAIITDAMRGTGTTQSCSVLGNRQTGTPVILENGVAKLTDRTSLAGSITSLLSMFRRLVKNTTIPFIDIVKMCSLTPAQIMGISQKVGSIEIGKIANLIELDDELRLRSVFQNGILQS